MSKQIPRGDENLVCPLHKETMDKVCHKCPLWMLLPNEDQQWNCALVWGPMMAFQNAKEAFALGKEMNELRNETKQSHEHNVAMGAIAVQRATEAVKSAFTEIVEGHYQPSLPLHDADRKALSAS